MIYSEVGERIELRCNAELPTDVLKILWYLMPINGVSKSGNALPTHVGSWYPEEGRVLASPGYEVDNTIGSLIILNLTKHSLHAVYTFHCHKFSTDDTVEKAIETVHLHGIGEYR